MLRVLSRAVVGLCLISGGSLSAASQEVVLANGQTLEVQSYRREGGAVIFLFKGGGQLALRSEHVVSIDGRPSRDPAATEVSRPAAPAPVPAIAPAAALLPQQPSALDALIVRLGKQHEVPPLLVAAVIQVESMWDPDAVSPKGAMGLMQLMPATAQGYGVTDPFDPAQNLEAGIAELSVQLRRHENEIALALAAYNAGGVAVKRYKGIPPYRETMDYIEKVLDLYYFWSEQNRKGELVGAGEPSTEVSR